MSNIKAGDLVRWETDVDKVYSKATKTLVGTMGTVLPPQEYYDKPFGGEKYLTPKGFYDVAFPYRGKELIVGNIPETELVLVLSVNE